MKLPIFILLAALLYGSNNGFAQESKPGKEIKAYMVADAHLDTQWNWDIQTTINEYVWNTLSQNLFLLKHYPHYVFNFEGAVKYSWMKEYYPIQYEEMKKYIREGRWHLSGSSWDATDALVPSTESAIRNILLGQEYYRQEFGTESTDIFLPDCFGFGWTLPTIAAHCGLIGFSSQKLDWRNHPFYGNSKHPFTIGLWQGIDGSQIMLAHGYGYGERWKDEDLSHNRHLQDIAHRNPFHIAYRYYGTGDTGGSPDLPSVRSVEKGIQGNGPVEIISATSDQLFKDFMPYEKHPELPVFNGELLMDVHGTGCYTSQAAMKLYNRQNEMLGDAAERAAVTASWLGNNYPGKTLTEAWRRFIFHQFHDDLTGTSIPRAYEFSWNDELISLKQFADVLTSSVNMVAGQLDTRTKGTPIILYNPLAFDLENITEISLEMPKAPQGITVYNAQGEKTKSQLIGYENGKARILIEARVPATGFAVYDVRTIGSQKTEKTEKPEDTQMLENSVYKITVDQYGDITSLFDKRNNREIVKTGKTIRLALFTQNRSYAWPAWEILKETIDRDPISITDRVKITQTENGAIRKTLCIEKHHGESVFKQYIHLYEGCLADRIDFHHEIDWRSTNALLKAEFPLSVNHPEATYDLGIGSIRRGNNTQIAYEVYAQQWADLSDQDNSYGVSILNDSKYGWDKPNDHTIRLTLLHTPETRGGYTYQNQQDFGHHSFTYSLIGHAGTLDKTATVRKAEILNQPLKAFRTYKHNGHLGKEFSFVRSDNPNVLIKALKKAESSDEYVVRVYETQGENVQNATLTFAGEILSAQEADGTEKNIGPADFKENKLSVHIRPYSIKTFKLKLKKATSQTKPLEYANLSLPYDQKCFTFDEFRSEGNFSGGYTYAAELLPDSLEVNGIPFQLGEKDAVNGLACQGQTIELPQDHHFNRLYILAASTEGDCTGTFRTGKYSQTISVPYFSGFIGQWGHLHHTEGYLKEAEIAHVGTHRHSAESNEAYEFTYMFKFGIDLPKGCSSVTLPSNKNIVLFAATLVQENEPVLAVSELFRTANLKQMQPTPASPVNLLKTAQIIAYSGAVNDKEEARFAIDGDLTTKWCDVNKAPNYIDFDLGESKTVKGWKIINAGIESHSYVTGACFVQGKNKLDEEWQTLDWISRNKKNVVNRQLVQPVSVRYLRLLVTEPNQQANSHTTRIYEFEIYE